MLEAWSCLALFTSCIIVSLSALERPFHDNISQLDFRMHICRKLEIMIIMNVSKSINSIFLDMYTR
jgi:hypothetical protein